MGKWGVDNWIRGRETTAGGQIQAGLVWASPTLIYVWLFYNSTNHFLNIGGEDTVSGRNYLRWGESTMAIRHLSSMQSTWVPPPVLPFVPWARSISPDHSQEWPKDQIKRRNRFQCSWMLWLCICKTARHKITWIEVCVSVIENIRKATGELDVRAVGALDVGDIADWKRFQGSFCMWDSFCHGRGIFMAG